MQAPLLSDGENGARACKGPRSIWKIAITVSLSAALLVGIMHGCEAWPSSPSTLNQPDELMALKASPLHHAGLSGSTLARPGYPLVPRQVSSLSSSRIPRASALVGYPLQPHRHPVVAKAESDGDPIGSPFIKFINGLQQGLQNSPLAEGKKAFAKLQAGDYDVAETRAKLDKQISTSPCIMYSFST